MHSALLERRLPWAVVIAASMAMAWLRFRYLSASAAPTGIDGYYYAVQVRSLVEDGHLYYPSAPLVLWLMRAVAAITGDPIIAVKLTAAFGTALIGVPIMGLCRTLGAKAWPAAAAAMLAATAPSASYLAAEFVKNGVALTVCVFFLWALAAAVNEPTRRRITVAAILLIATALSHKLALGIALIIAVPTVVVRAKRRILWFGVATASLAAAALAGAIWPARLPSLSAASLVNDLWTTDYAFHFAVYFFDGEAISFGGDVFIAAIAAAAIIALRIARKPVPPLLVALALWTLLVANPFIDVSDPNLLGPRLRLTAFVSAAACAGWLAHLASETWRPAMRLGVALGIACGLFVGRYKVDPPGIVSAHPNMLAAIKRLPAELLHDRVVIIPERSLVFGTVWVRRTPSKLRPEGVAPERRLRLLPFWFMSPEVSTLLRSATSDPPPGIPAPVALDPRHELTLVAVPERTWEWLLAQLPEDLARRMRTWPTI